MADTLRDIDLQQVHDFLVDLADKAGRMITEATPTSSASGTKKNSADLVTETDRAVEEMVSQSLRKQYPDFRFMGEETYRPGDRLTNEPTFVVDPIDGTTNFVHAYPYVSISLGFTINAVPVVGVVYNPFTRTLYSAVSGRGAYLNRTQPLPLKSSALGAARALEPLSSLQNALIALEWGSDRSGDIYKVKTKTFAKLCASKEDGGAMVHGVRSFGSAALNLCGVADGSLDVYWEGGCWAWDVCAGWVILKEAGGTMAGGNPGDWEPRVDGRCYLAVRKGAGKDLIEEFWSNIEGRLDYAAS